MCFHGWIIGIGTASGTRIVLGHWERSPFGSFSDVMIEWENGHRLLLAPSRQIADFVSATYVFDEVRTVPVTVRKAATTWSVVAGPLSLGLTVGRRGLLGLLLRAVPAAIAVHPAWAAVTDPLARLLLGVRTRCSAGGGRQERYGVTDLHPVVSATATYGRRSLGPLAPVHPAVRFGAGSTPRRPSVVRIRTTVLT
ncbi:hypothetical protein AB0C59_04410 [Streptomyces sp. NPDC048664]|uniref:hypothetical protein n=1 Tax=Streptomyces sp. NPDC048664 TaxID=3154505 RepID=UPI00343F3C86